jgi:hypothetical protein
MVGDFKTSTVKTSCSKSFVLVVVVFVGGNHNPKVHMDTHCRSEQ